MHCTLTGKRAGAGNAAGEFGIARAALAFPLAIVKATHRHFRQASGRRKLPPMPFLSRPKTPAIG